MQQVNHYYMTFYATKFAVELGTNGLTKTAKRYMKQANTYKGRLQA